MIFLYSNWRFRLVSNAWCKWTIIMCRKMIITNRIWMYVCLFVCVCVIFQQSGCHWLNVFDGHQAKKVAEKFRVKSKGFIAFLKKYSIFLVYAAFNNTQIYFEKMWWMKKKIIFVCLFFFSFRTKFLMIKIIQKLRINHIHVCISGIAVYGMNDKENRNELKYITI